jgi:hypothetical protein
MFVSSPLLLMCALLFAVLIGTIAQVSDFTEDGAMTRKGRGSQYFPSRNYFQ